MRYLLKQVDLMGTIVIAGLAGLFLFIILLCLITGHKDTKERQIKFNKIKEDLNSLGIHSPKEYKEVETCVVKNALQPMLDLGIHLYDLTRISSSWGICAYIRSCVYTSLCIEADVNCGAEPIEYILDFQEYAKRVDYLNIVGHLCEKEKLKTITDDDIRVFQRHIGLLKLWKNARFKMGLYRAIPESEIAYYRVIGDRQYISEVHGGGANIGNAIVGGVLAGDAGAIIGSRVGTDVRTKVQEKDNRHLFIYLKTYGGFEAEEIYSKNIDDVIDILRVWLPQKDYEYVSVFGANNLVNQEGNNTIRHNDSVIDELQEYRELMDLGIISREEYELKKEFYS